MHPYQTRDLCLWGVTHHPKCFTMMAGTTGLEPATSAVTGQRSNQLSYVPRVQPGLQKRISRKKSGPLFRSAGLLFPAASKPGRAGCTFASATRLSVSETSPLWGRPATGLCKHCVGILPPDQCALYISIPSRMVDGWNARRTRLPALPLSWCTRARNPPAALRETGWKRWVRRASRRQWPG